MSAPTWLLVLIAILVILGIVLVMCALLWTKKEVK